MDKMLAMLIPVAIFFDFVNLFIDSFWKFTASISLSVTFGNFLYGPACVEKVQTLFFVWTNVENIPLAFVVGFCGQENQSHFLAVLVWSCGRDKF